MERSLPTRSKSHAGSISSDHYANVDNIPPRHRHEVYSYRAHKRYSNSNPQQSSHNQHSAPSSQHQGGGNGPPRRQNSAGAAYHHSQSSRNGSSGHGAANNAPHSGRNSYQEGDKPPRRGGDHRGGEYGYPNGSGGRPQHSTSDTSSHHQHGASTSSQHSNRTHGAHHNHHHHRNSVSAVSHSDIHNKMLALTSPWLVVGSHTINFITTVETEMWSRGSDYILLDSSCLRESSDGL